MVIWSANDPFAVRKVGIQSGINGLKAGLIELDHALWLFVFGQEMDQETGQTCLRGKLVVVPQDPAQNFAVLGAVFAAELARIFDDVILNSARLSQGEVTIDHRRRFAHHIEGAKLGAAGGTTEKVDVNRYPVKPLKTLKQEPLYRRCRFRQNSEA